MELDEAPSGPTSVFVFVHDHIPSMCRWRGFDIVHAYLMAALNGTEPLFVWSLNTCSTK